MAALMSAFKAYAAFCVPPPEKRTPWTLPSLLHVAVPGLVFVGASFIRLRFPGAPFLVRLLYLLVASPVMLHALLSHYTDIEWLTTDGISHSIIPFDLIGGMAAFVGLLYVIELLFLGDDSDFEISDVDVAMVAESKKENGSKGAHTTADRNDARTSGSHDADRRKALARPFLFPGTFAPLEIDILASVRGFGYNRGVPHPTAGYRALFESKKLASLPAQVLQAQKWRLVRNVIWTTIKAYIVLDVCESIIQEPRIFPATTRFGPVSIEEAREGILGPFGPITVSFLAGVMVLAGIQYVYGFAYSITALLTSPQSIPITQSRFEPWLVGRPWKSRSVRDLWSQHWHALFRRCLVICAYKPTRNLTRRMRLPTFIGRGLATISAFALSGLAHEMCLEAAMPRFASWDRRGLGVKGAAPHRGSSARSAERGYGAFHFAVTRFFVYQAFAIIFEEVCTAQIEPWLARLLSASKSGERKPRLTTDESVRQWLGLLWTVVFLGWSGMGLMEALGRHGCFEGFGTFRLASTLFKAGENVSR